MTQHSFRNLQFIRKPALSPNDNSTLELYHSNGHYCGALHHSNLNYAVSAVAMFNAAMDLYHLPADELPTLHHIAGLLNRLLNDLDLTAMVDGGKVVIRQD